MSLVDEVTVYSYNDSYKIFRSILFRYLSCLKKGVLRLEMPSGEVEIFGEGGGREAYIKVCRPVFFKKCILGGDIGFGESYVDGDWKSPDLVSVIAWMIDNYENLPAISGSKNKTLESRILSGPLFLLNRLKHYFRDNTPTGSRKNISDHYDLSNSFFELFLDPTLAYSSAYFEEGSETLEDAQIKKFDRLCRQLRLQPKDRVLEIGSGWGGFACYAAKHYGVFVESVTISQQQYDYMKARIKKENLENQVRVLLKDYRDLEGSYDKVVSIEMLEAVGDKHLPDFFSQVHKLLKADGLLALQVILCPDSRYNEFRGSVDWIQKHIFPGSLLPSLQAIQEAISKSGELWLYDFKDLGASYVKTLNLWREEFNKKTQDIKGLGFSKFFLKKWNYYFSYCEAAFLTRHITVAQMLFARPNQNFIK